MKSVQHQYRMDIGLEIHIELNTKTKMFCGCPTAFGSRPNANTCPICLGMPGSLPRPNREAARSAILLGLACHCRIADVCRFDRKNYVYPDNPKNYQISQLYAPICREGFLTVHRRRQGEAGEKTVRIREIHIEEDAGKLLHDEEGGYACIDYNRAGVPLLEVVTQPDFSSADEAVAFLEEIRRMVRYLGISDGRMQEGSLRADVNLSLRPVGEEKLGTRTEMKNLASFRAIAKAVEREAGRQLALLAAGEKVERETRRFDEKKERTFSMRGKEEAKDYRYFPEPDIPVLPVPSSWIEELKAAMPELPAAKRERWRGEYSRRDAKAGHEPHAAGLLSENDILLLTEELPLAALFEEAVHYGAPPKKAAGWLLGEGACRLKEEGKRIDETKLTGKGLAELLLMIEKGEISRMTGRDIFTLMLTASVSPRAYAQGHGLWMDADEEELNRAVNEVVRANPKAVQDILGGKEKAMGVLIGQALKKMRGRAEPRKVQERLMGILKETLI